MLKRETMASKRSVSPPLNCADKLKILADNTRLSILRSLMKAPQHVNELNRTLQLEQSLLSHHLKVLREAGFVQGERDGKSVLYHLSPAVSGLSHEKKISLGCCALSFE